MVVVMVGDGIVWVVVLKEQIQGDCCVSVGQVVTVVEVSAVI